MLKLGFIFLFKAHGSQLFHCISAVHDMEREREKTDERKGDQINMADKPISLWRKCRAGTEGRWGVVLRKVYEFPEV